MAEPTREELEAASRTIQDVIDRSAASIELIQQAQDVMTQNLRPHHILQVFTSGTLANYEDNLRRLLHGYDVKVHEKKDASPGLSWVEFYGRIGHYTIDSAHMLRARVGHRALPPANDGYLSELAGFWRRYGDMDGPGHSMSWYYEDCWVFVAERNLNLE